MMSGAMRLLGSLPEERRVARAMVAGPRDTTVMGADGAVRSIQAADLTLPADELASMWAPMYLERLARTYWKFLSRVSLGLIRVRYTETDRAVVLLGRPLVLLRFHAPEYELEGDRGLVRWRIRDGVLVAERDRGHLEIEVRRTPADTEGLARVHVEVEVANFYPALSVWVARWFYVNTQSRIHVLVTYGFLRSLAHRRLEESAVGRFALDDARERQPPVTVGDTPWPLVLGLAAGAGAAAAVLLRRRQP
jgi:hypothetical protein